MSNRPSSSRPGSRGLSVAMIIVGGLLLLPGICALLFAQSRISYTIYAAGFVGLILVFWALQRLRR